jgi:hypothetical protein
MRDMRLNLFTNQPETLCLTKGRESKMSAQAQVENHGQENAKAWYASIVDMLAKLDAARGNDHEGEIEEAEQTIYESVLSVMVRDGWRQPGGEIGPNGDAEEYEILLTTGGPGLRIWGKLSEHGEPQTAELQFQDWFTPWSRHPACEETLIRFASCFYFGD